MRHLAHLGLLSMLALGESALAMNYRCQVASTPGLFIKNIDWDGSAPFQAPIQYNRQEGIFKVSAINLPGHPEYLFEIKIGSRTIFGSSQAKNLSDYNFTWRSDGQGDADSLISVACRYGGFSDAE